mmetsp:Transcript_41626/g.104976  ORF Transcript_41626/g.104976 Transcript_41626/m.104976 type:complete len:161 (+) Transcript_41626:1005-1487(+)
MLSRAQLAYQRSLRHSFDCGFLALPRQHRPTRHRLRREPRKSTVHLASTASDDLLAFADSDFATSADRRSHSGFVLLCHSAPVTWTSRKQQLVTTSTSEAEFVALTDALTQGTISATSKFNMLLALTLSPTSSRSRCPSLPSRSFVTPSFMTARRIEEEC